MRVRTYQTFNKSRGGFRDRKKRPHAVLMQYGYKKFLEVDEADMEQGESPREIARSLAKRLPNEAPQYEDGEVVYRTINGGNGYTGYEIWAKEGPHDQRHN